MLVTSWRQMDVSLPYVVTAPPKSLQLQRGDSIYVLCHYTPRGSHDLAFKTSDPL